MRIDRASVLCDQLRHRRLTSLRIRWGLFLLVSYIFTWLSILYTLGTMSFLSFLGRGALNRQPHRPQQLALHAFGLLGARH